MITHPHVNDGATADNTGAVAWNAAHAIGDALANANASAIPPGAPVYISTSGSMDLAKADNAATAECIGLMAGAVVAGAFTPGVAVAPGQSGLAQELDSMTLTTAQWDVVTGQVGGLTPGARYYVSSATAGKLTTVAPSTAGTTWNVSVATAITSTLMRLRVQMPIGN